MRYGRVLPGAARAHSRSIFNVDRARWWHDVGGMTETGPIDLASRAPAHTSRRFLWVAVSLHVIGAMAATMQRLASGSQINNFLIFRGSFFHLLRGQDLYAFYPLEHFDQYKYSPTWALLFAPFALPPIPVGLLLWNAVNAIALCAAIAALLPARAAAFTLLIAFFEALGAIQNSQSNGLVAALMVWALVAAERERETVGATAIAIGTSIKIFPVASGLFGLLGARPWRHVAACVVAGVALLAVPLVVTPLATLGAQHRAWGAIEATDQVTRGMMWLGGAIEAFVPGNVPHAPIQLVGVLWLLATAWLARWRWEDGLVRRLLLASLLLFATVFNHQAESPSYVIAFTGLGIWWSVLPRARWRDVVMLATLLLGSLAGTDLTSQAWRTTYHQGWQLKAIVASAAWIAMQYDVMRAVTGSRTLPDATASTATATPSRAT